MWTSTSGIAGFARPSYSNSLRQLLGSDGEAGGVAAGSGKLGQPVEKPKCQKYGRIDSNSYSGVALFDPLKRGAGRKSPLGHNARRKTSTPTGIAKVLPEVTERVSNGDGGAVGGWHECKLGVP
jgi:hypothetical protein